MSRVVRRTLAIIAVVFAFPNCGRDVAGPTAVVPTRLFIAAQPASTTAGATLAPVAVTVQDANGNTASTFSGQVSLAFGVNPGDATLGGTTTVAAVAGVAMFTGLSVNRVGTGYTFVAISGGLASATTTAFNITPGATTKLAFTRQPVNAVAGTTLGTVQVTAQDAEGNATPSFTGAVHVAPGANPGNGALGGDLTENAVGGVATFARLDVNRPGVGYTLTASASGLASATSTSFSIAIGQASILSITSGGGQSAVPGSLLAQIVVMVSDAAGNGVAGQNVTFEVTAGGGSVAPAGGTSNGFGFVTAMWTLGATLGAQTMTASSPGLTPSVLTINATATLPPLRLDPGSYSYGAWRPLGIGQYREGQYVFIEGSIASPLTITLSHTGTARTSVPASVTVPPGQYGFAYFTIAGTSAGTDTLVASAPGYNPATAAIVVDKGLIEVDTAPSPKVGDSVKVTVQLVGPGQSWFDGLVAPTTFTLAPNANIQLVSGGTPSVAITSITIPAGANSIGVWVKGVSAGVGSFTISNANYQTGTGTITVTP